MSDGKNNNIIVNCIAIQYGCRVTWVQTKNSLTSDCIGLHFCLFGLMPSEGPQASLVRSTRTVLAEIDPTLTYSLRYSPVLLANCVRVR